MTLLCITGKGLKGTGAWPRERFGTRPLLEAASLPRTDAINFVLADEKQLPPRRGRGRVVGVFQVVDGQDAELLSRLDHVALAGGGEEDPAVGVRDGARPGARNPVEALRVDL